MPRNFSELKSGGDNSYAPPTLKSGWMRPPVPHRSTPVQLPELVNRHCHCEATQKNTPDNTQPEIKPIIHTQLDRMCLFGFH